MSPDIAYIALLRDTFPLLAMSANNLNFAFKTWKKDKDNISYGYGYGYEYVHVHVYGYKYR